MSLHMALHATNLVLQTPPRMLERVIDRRINVSVAPVGIRLVPNIDLLFIRQSDADMDLPRTPNPNHRRMGGPCGHGYQGRVVTRRARIDAFHEGVPHRWVA
jgi:hypothetical protein